MEIELDVDQKMIYGTSIIEWTNPSLNFVDELQFHLYYNAFKNTQSTFMQDRDQFGFLSKSLEEECGWAYSEVVSLLDSNEIDLVPNSEYIAPDDGNEEDQTVLRVPLQKPVGPGESAVFKMQWKAKIPKAMVRTGYNQDYYFFAQWFPKLGVYEPAGMRYEKEGKWNCHQYHASGEYYGEFGNYDVSLLVPQNYVVASSGSLAEESIIGDQKRYRFEVNDVIDFTWSCSPDFQVLERQWKNVKIQLYFYPGHEVFAERYFTTAIQSLEYMDKYVGVYPYTTLTMVDPPLHGLFTGGMEYPTLITSLSSRIFPKGVKAPETLIVHEFVHQYFMQMVATHEQEEPWMDEGFTTYYEGRILDEYYGDKSSLIDTWGVRMGNGEYNRYEFWNSPNPKIADNSYKARDFVHGGYSEIAYNKTAMMLKTLEGILGRERFDAVMRTYFETWKFKHPCGLDFIGVFQESLDEELLSDLQFDLNLFFDQALYGTAECDFKVASISSQKRKAEAGFITSIDTCELLSESKDGFFKNKVVLNRLGEMIVPIDVLITFSNGDQKSLVWDGVKRSTEFVQESQSEIVKVQLDPDRKLNLEKNIINNTLMTGSSSSYRKYTSRFKVGMQHLLDFLNFLS
jgi:hypothetical protein